MRDFARKEPKMQTEEALAKDHKKPSQIHWHLIGVIAVETLLGDRYFPGWRLPMIATSMPAAFVIISLKKLYDRAGFWMLVAAFTILFWIINARLKDWMNGVGILSLVTVGAVEMLFIAAVIVRIYPEAKTR